MIPVRRYWNLLSDYLRHQRGRAAVLAVMLLVTIALQVLTPQLIRMFIDRATTGGDLEVLLPIAALFLVAAFGQQALSVTSTWLAERVGWTATNGLRSDLAAHLLGLDMGFHKAHTPGELVERIDGDVTALSNFFSQFVVHVVGNILLLIGILALLFLENLWIGLGITLFAAGALGMMIGLHGIATAWWRAVRTRRAEFYGFLGEVMGGTEDIRGNGATEYATRRFTTILRAWLPAEVRGRHGYSVLWGTNIAVFTVGSALVYWLGAWLFGTGAITLGSVYLVFHYTDMLRMPLDRIRSQMEDLQKAGAAIGRIEDLLARRSRLDFTGDRRLPRAALSVELDGIDFRYQEDGNGDTERVLHGLSFELKPGHVLGVLGRTGSGKTTLARLLTRLHDPEAGRLLLGGIPIESVEREDLRRSVGMITQDVQLFQATVRDNLTFFDPDVDDATIVAALQELGIAGWVNDLPKGLDTMLGGSGTGLSAGEAQLLAFTRIFLEDPGLVVLDEASSRLDPVTEQLIEAAVSKLLANRTGVIVAHRLDTVRRADDILILEDGKVAEYGARVDLLADPGSQFSRLLVSGMEEVLR